jgi:hypothetical protein
VTSGNVWTCLEVASNKQNTLIRQIYQFIIQRGTRDIFHQNLNFLKLELGMSTIVQEEFNTKQQQDSCTHVVHYSSMVRCFLVLNFWYYSTILMRSKIYY